MVATAIYSVVEGNRISSLQSHGQALENECCLPGVFCDSGDTLLCELNGHLMPCTSCFYGKWIEDVCTGQFGVFVYLVLRCLLGCCTWFSCCVANVGLSIGLHVCLVLSRSRPLAFLWPMATEWLIGSLTAGIWARLIALQRMSFK